MELKVQRKSDGYTLLHIAAHSNAVDCLKLMMDDVDTTKAILALKVNGHVINTHPNFCLRWDNMMLSIEGALSVQATCI